MYYYAFCSLFFSFIQNVQYIQYIYCHHKVVVHKGFFSLLNSTITQEGSSIEGNYCHFAFLDFPVFPKVQGYQLKFLRIGCITSPALSPSSSPSSSPLSPPPTLSSGPDLNVHKGAHYYQKEHDTSTRAYENVTSSNSDSTQGYFCSNS